MFLGDSPKNIAPSINVAHFYKLYVCHYSFIWYSILPFLRHFNLLLPALLAGEQWIRFLIWPKWEGTLHLIWYISIADDCSVDFKVSSSSTCYKLSLSARLISSAVWSFVCRSISTPWNRSMLCLSIIFKGL